jgi:hypothetical protein
MSGKHTDGIGGLVVLLVILVAAIAWMIGGIP